MQSYFLPNNCGKEAITLNLGDAEGRAFLHQLITALPVDVFACNQRPRSYAKLGIDYETLARLRRTSSGSASAASDPSTTRRPMIPSSRRARASWS